MGDYFFHPIARKRSVKIFGITACHISDQFPLELLQRYPIATHNVFLIQPTVQRSQEWPESAMPERLKILRTGAFELWKVLHFREKIDCSIRIFLQQFFFSVNYCGCAIFVMLYTTYESNKLRKWLLPVRILVLSKVISREVLDHTWDYYNNTWYSRAFLKIFGFPQNPGEDSRNKFGLGAFKKNRERVGKISQEFLILGLGNFMRKGVSQL